MRRFENINKYGLKPVNDANEKYALQLHRKMKLSTSTCHMYQQTKY